MKSHLKGAGNIAIVQARLNSYRFPGKVLKKINGQTIVNIIFERLKKSKKLDKIVFAIPNDKEEEELYKQLKKSGANIYLGDEVDVLDRYYKAAMKYRAKNILRVTGDCPLVDPELVDQMISFYEKNSYDYVNNNSNPTYPHGLDLEFFSFQALRNAWKKTKKLENREHVTFFLKENEKIKKFSLVHKNDFSNLRWTIDFPVDYQVVKKIYEHFKPNIFFGWKDALNFCLKNEKILVNKYLERKPLVKVTKKGKPK